MENLGSASRYCLWLEVGNIRTVSLGDCKIRYGRLIVQMLLFHRQLSAPESGKKSAEVTGHVNVIILGKSKVVYH